ncbi:hypothetical protein BU26DRAFT_572195 [Trematosphaeria pertusa]|uniref:Uncharacterized protein n=1 Tax=Trematosphaeria pertusa TaxID=390896 RepID=A0A6A6HSI3_9PLEO|nr:uncharacterized protein BU26DRAFT_572195 [Trematosphaeria pertusa]KAF2240957.1 hypothetical protein BU26DRAFT_572195 [Trematosphaeria pertusa]
MPRVTAKPRLSSRPKKSQIQSQTAYTVSKYTKRCTVWSFQVIPPQAPDDAATWRDPGAPLNSKNSSSRLLQLPGELRNRIYEYVLTDPSPLGLQYSEQFVGGTCISKPWLKPRFEGMRDKEITKIKYVCRKLYAETAGLEIKFNSLRFSDSECPARMFKDFLAICSPSKAAWIRTVVLRLGDYSHCISVLQENIDTLLPIADFCRRNPQATVKYTYGAWEYSPCCEPPNSGRPFIFAMEFIEAGVHLTKAFRGQDLDFLLPPSDRETWEAARDWRAATDEKKLEGLQAPNFKFWPGDLYLDPGFANGVRRDAIIFDLEEDIMRLWVEYAKKWGEEGI